MLNLLKVSAMINPLCNKNMKQIQVFYILILIFTAKSSAEYYPDDYAKKGCNVTCGNVSIPYPFGIGATCSVNKWYVIDCNSSIPYLSAFNNMEVLGVSLEEQTVTVNVPVISRCRSSAPNSNHIPSIDLGESPFVVSASHNILTVEGCGYAAILGYKGQLITGCSTICANNTTNESGFCFGLGCCQNTIPYSLKSYSVDLTGLKMLGEDGTCGSAFLGDEQWFPSQSILPYHHLKTRNTSSFPIALKWFLTENDFNESLNCWERQSNEFGVGLTLDDGSYIPLRKCNCGIGREGNPYLHYQCEGVSICMGLLFLAKFIYEMHKLIKKTIAKRQKEKFFKHNGGLLLKQQEATKDGLVDKTILFTSKELETATDHFNENRILGRGGQGTVYKGMLADGRIVAVKKAKIVDESQLEVFINEVVILAQVNHRNVFVPKGTLYDYIQDDTGLLPFSLNMRLQIAAEVAGAVSYLHSETPIPIYHRDIKTTNVLLDEKYRAKVSDFGTSRLVSLDQTHLTTLVKGTFGYFDPEYFQSSQFTEKSDVYSFGVVLLELFTREKPISLTRFGEHRNLATYFIFSMDEGRAMSIFDPVVVNEDSKGLVLEIANLAMRCLNSNGKHRPTMKEVAMELEGMRMSHVPATVQTSFGHANHNEDRPIFTYDESTPTTLSLNDSINE
ncbi:putative protein kinase RLK-Pelle-WAK family [Helianthus annuus]|uniref:Protein kinase domain-containing protein n=1 Tax=Helianthus annuus TaxID=4232 RepID=A0A9K3EA45_HELAN|nr:putative protein kinase RLK-Pelle-WAK family [Helianthus annuus]KAJ0486136.1 putative protein kinase RLK-Pelle-WAK family [Helianthus annuus]